MSWKFNPSFLENAPCSTSTKTREENIYFDSQEAFGGEYCELASSNSTFAQNSASRHPAASGYVSQERNSNTQNSVINELDRNKRHMKITLQDPARQQAGRWPVASTNRVNRGRIASDSEVLNSSTSSKRAEEWNRCARVNAAYNPEPTVRVQSNGTPNGRRIFSEGLPSNSNANTVITNQPKPRGILLREPTTRERDQEQEKSRKTSKNSQPKPRIEITTEGVERMHDFEQKSIHEQPKISMQREDNSRAYKGHTEKLDLNMNRTKSNTSQRSDKTTTGHDRLAMPTAHQRPPKEGESVNYGESRKGEERGTHHLSDVSSPRPRGHLESVEREAAFLGQIDNTREDKKAVPLTGKVNRDDELEMKNMATACNPRILQLKREETSAKAPLLGLAFPRPHSLDVHENKTPVLRTLSSPELRTSRLEDMLITRNNDDTRKGNEESPSQHKNPHNQQLEQCNFQSTPNTPKTIRKIKGKRSTSLPGNVKCSTVGRRGPSAEPNPLRYFAYLGKRFQIRERLLSAHNVLIARPVILTSTSVISPEVSNNFCQQLEEQETDPCATDVVKHQGACEDLIDCCTCMCCVKALFYHCTKDDENEGQYDGHPCSCSGPGADCFCRWSVLGMLSLFMPCILCYLPVQGCKLCVEYLRRKPSAPDCE